MVRELSEEEEAAGQEAAVSFENRWKSRGS
jgi:hypothetical protein